jgi:hypothetical protein
MDHRKFDRLTRLFGAPRSRRTALRALLSAALLGATTRTAMATSSTPCELGAHEICGGECCPGKCFEQLAGGCPVCCTEPDFVICVGKTTGEPNKPTCCKNNKREGEDPCRDCQPPTPICPGYVGGSYRRR